MIYLPEWHFPQDATSIEVTGGKWKIENEDLQTPSDAENSTTEEGETGLQVLRWWHAEGEQKLVAKGVKRKIGGTAQDEVDLEEEESYLEQCRQRACTVM